LPFTHGARPRVGVRAQQGHSTGASRSILAEAWTILLDRQSHEAIKIYQFGKAQPQGRDVKKQPIPTIYPFTTIGLFEQPVQRISKDEAGALLSALKGLGDIDRARPILTFLHIAGVTQLMD